MHNHINTYLCLGALLAAISSGPAWANPADKEMSGAAEPTAKESKPKAYPFHGKLSALDKANRTITLEGKEKPRVYHLTSQTRLSKAGKPATLEDAVVGEEVAGLAQPAESGKLEAVSLRFGAKPEVAPQPKKERKSRPKS